MVVNTIAAIMFVIGARELPSRYEYSQVHMGVRVAISLYAYDKEKAEGAARAAFARFAELEQAMSDYRADSEVRRLCDLEPGEWHAVGKDLFAVLSRAQDVAEATRGAFDVTCGPVIRLWREARVTKRLPSEPEREAAVTLVGWNLLALDPERTAVRLARSGMRIDLGGIAKGYACDEAIAVLAAQGIDRALVEAGGDIVASGAPPGKLGWAISAHGERVWLKNAAISTSGDTEQYVVVGGKRYSHIVDPRTGIGLTSRVQVTVIAPDGLTSDSLATALSVFGEEGSAAILERYRATARFRVAR